MDSDQKQGHVPLETLAAPARFFSRRKTALAEEIQRTEHIYSLRNEYIAELIATTRPEVYPKYAQIRAETRRKLRSIPKPNSVTLNDMTREHTARREILSESQQLITSLGIDGEEIKRIQRTYADKVRLELETRLRDEMDIPAQLREASNMFMALRATPIPNVTFSSAMVHTFDEGTPNAWRHTAGASADVPTQYLNTGGQIAISSASDNEFANTTAEAGLISDFFVVPSTGKIKVWMSLDAREIISRGFVVNEWGVSDLFGWSEIRCFVRLWHLSGVLDETGGTQTFWTAAVYGPASLDPPYSWDIVMINPGERMAFGFTSSQVWPAGDLMHITVGIGLFHAVWSDDVTYQADVASNWTLSGISLQSVP